MRNEKLNERGMRKKKEMCVVCVSVKKCPVSIPWDISQVGIS